MVYTDEQVYIIHWVTLAASTLSMFGSAFILVSFFLFGKGKGLIKLIVFLALGDFGWSTSVVVNNILLLKYGRLSDPVCFAFRGLFQFFAGSTVFWTLWIGVYLYMTVFHGKKDTTVNSLEKDKNRKETAMMLGFHVIAWGEPLGVIVYCYGAKIFAQANNGIGLCYPNSNVIHFWSWFFPIIVCFAISLAVYVLLVFRLTNITSWKFIFKTFTRHTTTLSLPFRVSVYLLIFLLCWSLDIVQFILSKMKSIDAETDFIILVVYSALLQLQGAFDCIVYGLSNKELRNQHSLFIEEWGKWGPVIMTVFVLMCPILVIPTFFHKMYHIWTAPPEPEFAGLLSNPDFT